MIESKGAVVAATSETQTPQRLSGRTNERLRSARRSWRSPSGSGRVLSRQELADGCNAIQEAMYAKAGHARRWAGMTAIYIGALERGEVRWPNQHYRAALRAFFNATDIDLGFYIDRPERPPVAGAGAPAEVQRGSSDTGAVLLVYLAINPNTALGRAYERGGIGDSAWNEHDHPVEQDLATVRDWADLFM